MASYQERGDRVRAIIRLKGHKPVSKTFRNKTQAKQWATKTEAAMIQGDHVNPTKTTFRTLASATSRKRSATAGRPTGSSR